MLWHVVAFAFGGVYVYDSYRAVLGFVPPEKYWKRIIRRADLHLWLSGFAVIAAGAALTDVAAYFSNPKLWAKIVVITIWLMSTQYMRRYAMLRFIRGDKGPMLVASAVNVSCWFYGAFLGCAKGFANGAVPFEGLVGGFVFALLVSALLTSLLYVISAKGKI